MSTAEGVRCNFETILVEQAHGVARITLNRPARANALSQAMLSEIGQALDALEADGDVRALVVRGAGATFSSGFDLKEQLERRPAGRAQWQPILRKDFDTIMRFWHFPKPTIAAVRGACLAGACELALACDMTIAAPDAFFGEPELKFGAGIVVMILPWIVGPKVAKEIILTGEDRIDAKRALAIGMINRIVPAKSSRPRAFGWPATLPRSIRNWSKKPSAPSIVRSKRRHAHGPRGRTCHRSGHRGGGFPDKARFMEVARVMD
jgi:enoyl-CoA hydratase/carnithine racemase